MLSKGQPHCWTASSASRVALGNGCAVYAGWQACVCNSLESLFPSVAAEVDVDKNGFGPSEVTAGSGKKVWWRSTKRGSWMLSVNARTLTAARTSRTDCTHQVLLLCCCVVLCRAMWRCAVLCCAVHYSHRLMIKCTFLETCFCLCVSLAPHCASA